MKLMNFFNRGLALEQNKNKHKLWKCIWLCHEWCFTIESWPQHVYHGT
jgi:hypothetical protein